MEPTDVQYVTHDDDTSRQAVDQWLRQQLDDVVQVPLMSKAWEGRQRVQSVVMGAYRADQLVGGLWGGDPYTEILMDPAFALRTPDVVKRVYFDTCDVLCHLAVAPELRGQGIGRELLTRFEQSARARGKSLIYGVAGPTSLEFYRRAGYRMSERNTTAVLRFGPMGKLGITWPLFGDSVWFARQLTSSSFLQRPKATVQFQPNA